MNWDATDLKVLKVLERDGRITYAAIGREIGLTGPAVYARVQRMEKLGLIRGYRADIDPAVLGKPITAFVRITTRPIKVDTDTLEPFILSDDRIVECHDIASEDTFILKVRCASPEDLRELLFRIRERPQVLKTTTSVALATVKEIGLRLPMSIGSKLDE